MPGQRSRATFRGRRTPTPEHAVSGISSTTLPPLTTATTHETLCRPWTPKPPTVFVLSSRPRRDDERMTDLVHRALALWSTPLPEGDAAVAAFRSVYADPLAVNGSSTPLQVLVDRARMMQGALEHLRHEIHERFETPGRRAFAFRILGRHVGPFSTPLGEVAATGRPVELVGMDIFLVDEEEGRITGVWAIADYLGLLIQMDAIDRPTAAGELT